MHLLPYRHSATPRLRLPVVVFFRRLERNYPQRVEDVMDDKIRYKRGIVKALKRFKESGALRAEIPVCLEAMNRLVREFAAIHGLPMPTVEYRPDLVSCCLPHLNLICLDKMSIVTLLHEYAHLMGYDEWHACWWSINLFRKVYPEAYAKLEHQGHMLVRPKS